MHKRDNYLGQHGEAKPIEDELTDPSENWAEEYQQSQKRNKQITDLHGFKQKRR